MSGRTRPSSVSELIDAMGGNTVVARIIGKPPSTVGEQKRNGSIPVEYWPSLLAAARERGVSGLTYEALVEMHVSRRAAEMRA